MQTHTAESPAIPPLSVPTSRAGKYLIFKLEKEEFALEVLRVKEIMGIQSITSVPQTPSHIKGVINLRGKIVPVADLRLKFNLPPMEYTERTCIIVVQLADGLSSLLMGIVVDGVVEVLNIAECDIEDAPTFGGDLGTPHAVLGLAKVKDRVKILLNIDKTMDGQDLQYLNSIIR